MAYWAVPVLLVTGMTAALWHSGRAAESHPVTFNSARLGTLFDQARALQSAGDKVAFWSEHLLDDPRLLAPLGNGPTVNDTAPVFPHHFNCTTFVETVGGLAHSETVRELADRIISLRYNRGEVGYGTRNHFPEADWIPNNESAGNLQDITLRVARDSGLVAAFAHKDIDKNAWFKQQGSEGRVIASDQEPIAVSLPYVPIDKIGEAEPHIPQGAIVNIVRQSRDTHPVLITHQAVLVREDGQTYLIHASNSRSITRVKLADYLESMKVQQWPVVGLNVNML